VGTVTGSVDLAGCEWLQYPYGSVDLPPTPPEPLTMWRYRDLLPVPDGPVRYPVPVGGTPLLRVPALHRAGGLRDLWVKDETRNPTGCTKDRATALVIEEGLRRGLDTVTVASTGNAGVTTAFGAAAAGVRSVVFVSADCRPEKLALMAQAGAWVFRVPSGQAAALDLSRAAARTFGWLDRNPSANPLTLEAGKTVALEIWEQLGRRPPDVVIAPVGDGPTMVALDKGFAELVICGLADRRPRLVGVQAARCQPVVRAWLGMPATPAELDPDGTVADGIAVLMPAMGEAVLDVVSRGGGMVAVGDDALLDAVGLLASRTGISAGPAGAAALAGLVPAVQQGLVDPSETVVLLVTGREVKASRRPRGSGRVASAAGLSDVHRVLSG
jgi:threonine synthase